MSIRKVNTSHDTTSYENCSYQRDISDGNALYDAFLKAKQGSDWKPHVQRFEMNWFTELAAIQKHLRNGSFEFLPTSDFISVERGKTRAITGEQVADRVVKHSLCDEILNPSVRKYLIYDNGASLKGKGIDFTRRRLLVHLRKYYAQHKSNDGYILLIDFSKYYDNIRHEQLMDLFYKYVSDEKTLWLLSKVLDRAKVDVSYMSDTKYEQCMYEMFNSLEYQKIDKTLLTGEKFMAKHLNIGDQVAQTAGIMYPIPIDNYVKIVRAVKFYGRYMDDSYAIHQSKEFLQDLFEDIVAIANSIGITVNRSKTRICKLSEFWRFLQIQYSLTDTGRVIQKINPKRLTNMRRKMKKLAYTLEEKAFEDWYYSWYRNHSSIMSKQQRQNLTELFQFLKEENYVYNHTRRQNAVEEPRT